VRGRGLQWGPNLNSRPVSGLMVAGKQAEFLLCLRLFLAINPNSNGRLSQKSFFIA